MCSCDGGENSSILIIPFYKMKAKMQKAAEHGANAGEPPSCAAESGLLPEHVRNRCSVRSEQQAECFQGRGR